MEKLSHGQRGGLDAIHANDRDGKVQLVHTLNGEVQPGDSNLLRPQRIGVLAAASQELRVDDPGNFWKRTKLESKENNKVRGMQQQKLVFCNPFLPFDFFFFFSFFFSSFFLSLS